MKLVMEVNHNNLPQAVSNLFSEIDSLKCLIRDQFRMEDQDPNERLTRKEIKEQYKVCFSTIHSLMKKGRLPYVKIGRKTLFKRKDVETCFTNINS